MRFHWNLYTVSIGIVNKRKTFDILKKEKIIDFKPNNYDDHFSSLFNRKQSVTIMPNRKKKCENAMKITKNKSVLEFLCFCTRCTILCRFDFQGGKAKESYRVLKK